MGFYETSVGTVSDRRNDLPLKNRVRNFSETSDSGVWAFFSQTIDLHQQTRDTSTKTVSGMSFWGSRDPIGEKGGPVLGSRLNPADRFILEDVLNHKIDMLTFVGNDSVNHVDVLGLLPNPTFGDWRKVCCRTEQILHLFTHCEVKEKCDKDDTSGFDITVDTSSSRKMDNGIPCNCVTSRDRRDCWMRNPPGTSATSTWGDNCQTTTIKYLASCCLKSNWSPAPYAGSTRGRCLKMASENVNVGGIWVIVTKCVEWEYPVWQTSL